MPPRRKFFGVHHPIDNIERPTNQLTVGNDQVTPVTSIRNLGIYTDAGLSMRTQYPPKLLLAGVAALLFFVALKVFNGP